jgi:hypothetical protein
MSMNIKIIKNEFRYHSECDYCYDCHCYRSNFCGVGKSFMFSYSHFLDITMFNFVNKSLDHQGELKL